MGGLWRLRLPVATPAVRKLVQSVLDVVEAQMSAWRPDSALCRINASPVGAWVSVPAEALHVLQAGLDLMQAAPGGFSILLGGVSAQGGFQPGAPRAGCNDAAMLEVSGGQVRRMVDVTVDLNALAKGFAADLVALALRKAGQSDFLIEIAGDIVTHGQRPDGLPWTVALELPLANRIVPARLIPVYNAGVATSGGYRRHRGEASHLINPATGRPLLAGGASVAVVASTGIEADGWATVMSVLGPEAGLALAEARGLAVSFIAATEGGFIEQGSSSMANWISIAA